MENELQQCQFWFLKPKNLMTFLLTFMQKKFWIFLVKVWVVLVAGAINPTISNAQFLIPSVIGFRKRTGCKGQQKIEFLQIVVTKLEDECNFISNFFVWMHFTGQKKKLNDVTHTVSYLWAFPAEPHPPIIFVLLLFIFAWQARLLLSLLCSFLIWRNLSENSHEIYIA